MADFVRGGDRWSQQQQQQQYSPEDRPVPHQIIKAVTAATAGGSLLLLSGLILTGTVIGLTVATPLLVIFSPVLVPAGIAVALLVAGFVTSGGFGVAALSVLSWMYRYTTGKRPMGADGIDQARAKISSKARELKDSAQQRVEQATS
ncbi:hypothetical protein KSP39_PZI008025 [Platanthera zijinensis]|uniref:Oleosin n=1 Tax=Platanthera zijinensis TaxID=2320716 RepID=A0AAP0BNE8_9ASPA